MTFSTQMEDLVFNRTMTGTPIITQVKVEFWGKNIVTQVYLKVEK